MLQIRERRAICISRQRFVCGAEAKEKTKEIEENPAENRGEELEVYFTPHPLPSLPSAPNTAMPLFAGQIVDS